MGIINNKDVSDSDGALDCSISLAFIYTTPGAQPILIINVCLRLLIIDVGLSQNTYI